MNIMHYIEQGGVIMYILLFLNILGFTTMIVKFIQFLMARSRVEALADTIYAGISQKEHEAQEVLGKELVTEKMVSFERGLSTVRIIASIAPLLGLLGTVIGVLEAFNAISRLGLGDPSVFAGGISLALITTVGGLVVAIPHYIGYNYLISMLDKIEAKLGLALSERIFR
jgi:biopolymer transport protein ExbB